MAIQVNKNGTTINPGNMPPITGFTFSCDDFTQVSIFDGSGLSGPDGNIITCDCDFGDGNIVSGLTTTRTYVAGGNYTIVLTATDNEDSMNTDSQQANVGIMPTMHIGDLDTSTSTSNGGE